MKLLHIDSSVNGDNSVSRQLTKHIVELWAASHSDIEIDYLDLASAAPSHLSAESMSFRLPLTAAELSEVQKRENILSEALVTQFLAADVIVVGAPLYNFSIPSQLKAWIDRIAQVGRTFKYIESGPVGLATGKTVIVASSRGGIYSTSEASRAMEHQESYLQIIFGFFGISDVRFVRAEGLNMGDDIRARAIAAAREDIKNLDTVAHESEALIAA
ncbi:MAG: FMN-dependent NADH-azoreductase [Candidimonas sp.]|nr:MAG: FMN-dependent NADH-azoreductase [Candidimonas sp.]TAM24508.1 MAG: FMN-dependent NADH-azoreductase [Candidimonas sp.]TAM80713.1 MAG: FMN-dependent NADH-azoreductase [Candidimonas sp.]